MLYNLDYKDISVWYVASPCLIACCLIAISLSHLFLASYPSLKGGEESMFYFKSIGSRTEQKYISEFLSASDDDIEKDILGQIWRNSQILAEKFSHVEKAFRYSLISTVPWVLFLLASSVLHSRSIVVK
ncbi:Pycsar system effector family protein [Sphingomonas vulcanisoli]|uniref:Pycsar system effector family protein n=1 Tax=Sphingomonas vulcanisoli TaxID=1658060 RepID=UPI003C7E3CD4